jgi:hypothetical protein
VSRERIDSATARAGGVLAILALPAGNYLVAGSADFWNNDNVTRQGGCQIQHELTALTQASTEMSPDAFGSISVQDVLSFTEPTTITLVCSTPRGEIFKGVLTALVIDTVHEQVPPGPPTGVEL